MRPRNQRLAIAVCLNIAFLSVFAQTEVDIIEINPIRSTLDAVNPDGASGGRVNGISIASDGITCYAASEWGGIYKSTDIGKTWGRLDGHLPTVTWDVEVDPSNINRVYATSFYDGKVISNAGINVSTDGGVTWIHPGTANPPAGMYTSDNRRNEPSAFGICIDPDNPQNVYIGTNAGLAISNDFGATWNYVDPTPTNIATNIWDVVVHSNSIIDVVGDDGHFRSIDGGTTWSTAVTNPLPGGISSIAVSPFESYVLFAVVGTLIFESDDGGNSWPTRLTNPIPQGRVPFVKTNKRSGNKFDLWFGDVELYRTICSTPDPPAPGGQPRAPTNSWIGPFTSTSGGHDDVGDIAFDPTVNCNKCPRIFSSDGGVYYNTRTKSEQFLAVGRWTGSGNRGKGWHIGDFNGDGMDDMFRYLNDDGGAEVLLSNGNGFNSPVRWTGSGNRGKGWYIGDFNGDGMDDIFRYVNRHGGAEVLLSNGNGFSSPVRWTGSGNRGKGWHIGDFDGDGMDDIFRYLNEYGGAEVLLSNGSGFSSPVRWTGSGNRGKGWHIGDFNGDGMDDIFRYLNEYGGAEVLLSNGNGFSSPVRWTGSGNRGKEWHIGDYNGDGMDDIFRYVNQYGGAEVLLSTGNGFSSPVRWTGSGNRGKGWHIGDFNGDGMDDIFRYMNQYGGAEMFLSGACQYPFWEQPNETPKGLWVFGMDGVTQTHFASASRWTGAGNRGKGWHIGDFNGDGMDDIFRYLNEYGGAEVLLSYGNGFSTATRWTGSGNRGKGWHIGDFNGDGMDDIFRYLNEHGGAEVLLSNGSGFSSPARWTGSGNRGKGWHIGDFNGDDMDDIFRYLNDDGGAEVLISNGSGFNSPVRWSGSGNRGKGWHIGDFNGDGMDDIFRYVNQYGGAEVLLSNGNGFGSPERWTGSGNRGKGWHMGDFNGDGMDDIFRYLNDYGGAEVLLSNGSSFDSPVKWTGYGNRGKGWHIGDYNGDGMDDIFRYVNQYGGAEVIPAEKYANLYFGNQDNGTFSTIDATRSQPVWLNNDCCDGFDVSADNSQVLYTLCCYNLGRENRLFIGDPGMENGAEINTYPPGNILGFRPANNIAQFGNNKYAVLTSRGVFITQNIKANPISWTQIGVATSPPLPRGIKVGYDDGTPTFYVQSPLGNLRNADNIWRYVGINAGANWTRIIPPGNVGGFNVYDVDTNDPDRLFASHLRPGRDPQMVFSEDGGNNWITMPELDSLLIGGGVFNYRTQIGPTNFTGFDGYPQTCLIAFDPNNSDIMIVGGVDSGIFLSIDNGNKWSLISDPVASNTSSIPHIPRPEFAYFFHGFRSDEYEDIAIFIGSQGRGIWRINARIEY